METEGKKIVLVGGGGHSKVLIEIIRMLGVYEIVGILTPSFEVGTVLNGINVIGNDDMLPGLKVNGTTDACIAIGSIKDNSKREKMYKLAKEYGFSMPQIIHPRAIVSNADTTVTEGVQIMAGAIIQTGSWIGENTIINTGAIIEHDCVIGNNAHICPGAVVCGGSVIGDNSFIGAGATVIQGIEIGKGTVVGAGEVIRTNISDGVLVRGGMNS